MQWTRYLWNWFISSITSSSTSGKIYSQVKKCWQNKLNSPAGNIFQQNKQYTPPRSDESEAKICSQCFGIAFTPMQLIAVKSQLCVSLLKVKSGLSPTVSVVWPSGPSVSVDVWPTWKPSVPDEEITPNDDEWDAHDGRGTVKCDVNTKLILTTTLLLLAKHAVKHGWIPVITKDRAATIPSRAKAVGTKRLVTPKMNKNQLHRHNR